MRSPCPCCSFRALKDVGAFELCPVCYWEDDGQNDADSDLIRGGPNGTLSLSEARINFAEFGASDLLYTGLDGRLLIPKVNARVVLGLDVVLVPRSRIVGSHAG